MTTATLDRPADARTTAATILQRAVCLTLECHYLGNHRTVDLKAVVDAAAPGDRLALAIDAEQFNTVKRLVDPAELRPAMRVFGLAKAYLRSRAIGTHRVFGERSYLVPLPLVAEVDAQLVAYAAQLDAAAADLADRYSRAVAAQAAKLGPMFDARDYKTAGEVRQAFRVDWSYVSFAAPEKLETVDRALFEGAQRKYEQRMGDAYDEVKLVLRETLWQLTADIAQKLAPAADGKPRVFRGTVLKDLTDFLGTFDLRNLTDDAELAEVVGRLKGLTAGVDPDALREFDALRGQVLGGMEAATASLDYLVATGRRGIRFGSLDG